MSYSLIKEKDKYGKKKINQYTIIKTLGKYCAYIEDILEK